MVSVFQNAAAAILLCVHCLAAIHPAFAQAEFPLRAVLDDTDGVQQRELLQLLREAEQLIEQRDWVQAAAQFDAGWQRVCTGEDPLLTAAAGEVQELLPGQSQLLAGGRSRMINLFRVSPVLLREEYRRQFQASGEARLREAVAAGDLTALKEVAARWRFVPAGETAVRLGARWSISRGEFLDATLQLERLRQMSVQTDDRLDLQIAISAWKSGLTADAVTTLRSLVERRPNDRILIGDRPLQLPSSNDSFEGWLTEITEGIQAPPPHRWTQPLGDFRRGRAQQTGPVDLNTRWTSDLFMVNDILFEDQLNPLLARARNMLRLLSARYLSQNSTVIPVAAPLILDDLLIFRTVAGARAVERRTGELIWETSHPDGRLRGFMESPSLVSGGGSADPDDESLPQIRPRAGNLIGPAQRQQAFNAGSEVPGWELFLQQIRTNPAGQLAASDRTVFVVEDSGWVTWSADPDMRMAGGSRLPANYLRAYDAQTGVFRWEAGGQRAAAVRVNLLSGFYFLGAPLVLGSRIYVLAESNEGIFLLQIGEPLTRGTVPSTGNPRILHSQLLAAPRFSLLQHPVRKHAGLIPSYAQGLIICPTCDEHIVAVSAEDHSVRWAYRYSGTVRMPELGAQEPVLAGALNPLHSRAVDLNSRWTDSLPRICGDTVIVTPRDSDQLYCLRLDTGEEVYRIPRGLSRTVAAVTADTLVLTGTQTVTAHRLNDGGLLWTHQLRDGQICGNAASDGRILHVPTTQPAVITYELATGRRLVSRTTDQEQFPGNLLCLEDLLYSQNLTSLSCLGTADPSSVSPSGSLPGVAMLLNGRIDEAISEMKASYQKSATEPLRDLMIDVLLESLRVDFGSGSPHLQDLRQLIGQTSVDETQIASALLSMLGMTPGDAAVLPAQVEALDRSGRQLDYLFEMIVRALASLHDADADQLAAAVGDLLPELLSARQRTSTSGFLSRRNSRLLTAGIRRAVSNRSAAERAAVQTALSPRIAELAAAAASLPAAEKSTAIVHLIRDLLAAGLRTSAQQLYQTVDADQHGDFASLLFEQMAMSALSSNDSQADELLESLWDDWMNHGQRSAATVMTDDLLAIDGLDGRHHLATMKFHAATGDCSSTPQPERLRPMIETWRAQHPDLSIVPLRWQSNPVVTKSDDSSQWPAGQQRLQGPQSLFPLFGMPGLFRGWAFVQEAENPAIVAYDASGNRRWTFLPELPQSTAHPSGLISEKYVMAAGHLLAVKMHHMLMMLDTSRADAATSPRLLWSVDLTALHHDEESMRMRQHIPGWERLSHYDVRSPGFYPCGPLTADAVAVVSGRSLFVFDSFTGERHWQLEGIPADAVLLGTDEHLLILSESERQIEVRDLIDGELLSVAAVPDWWIDANENVGASVRDIEVEPGLDLLWRVAVHGRSALLFRLAADQCQLELRDVAADRVLWSVQLPQDSVFSNVAEDMVAVLSNGSELRILRIDTGTELTSLNVTPVKAPRELYLRPSQNRLIVLPEAVEDPSLDLDPVGSGLHVFGRMYAVDRGSWQLAWDQPLDHRYLRPVSPQAGPMLASAPVLVLLARGPRPGTVPGGVRATVYSTRIVDVATGEDLHREQDAGNTLNYHWMTIDAEQRRLQISFDRHILTLDYLPAKQP